jgi:hypothetical protein
MGGPGTHHCSPEGNEPDPIWCQGHGAFQWFPCRWGRVMEAPFAFGGTPF